ncbi:MAG: GNAT family N-acetyltransferase [Cyclobacteriaceae bacterium]|nr:GNAT family N-acetyltransferase [Cyclobacteriaceae bacterium]
MNNPNSTITKIKTPNEVAICAKIFSESEPWISLKMASKYFLDLINNPLNETYTLKVENEIAGVIILQLQGPIPGYVKSFVIDKKWAGKGYGKVLLKHAEERIFKDIPNVFLCVSSSNTGAYTFYQKLGYKKVGEFEDYLIKGESELLLRKTKGPMTWIK